VGGVAFHATELGCALERLGNEVHIFTRLGRPDHAFYEKIHGVHYHRCPYAGSGDFLEDVNHMCRAFVKHFAQIEAQVGRFDVVHAHDWLTADALAWAKEGRGHRSILTIHSTEYGRCGNNFFGGNSERVRNIERNGAYHADNVIAVSQALKNEIQWIYEAPEEKVDVVYNGVNYEDYDGWTDAGAVRQQYSIGPLDPMVLFCARMVYQKGPDLLVEAMVPVLNNHPQAKFVFAGDGEMRYAVEEQARNLNVSHAARFLGRLDAWRLADLYKATDCVCLPSRNEPFGIVILEAWSAGKPVVATSIGGPEEIVWHEVTGYKIMPNPESIAWGIGTLFADFDRARWMGRMGRVAVETAFSWDIIANQVLAVYAE
jgi:glycosyltransferase involved in cell wall biosynthesis